MSEQKPVNVNSAADAQSLLNVGLGWVSVEDRLPEYDVNVFVAMPSGIAVGMRWYDQDGWLWCVADYIDGDLASAECLCDDDYSSITHWMPIMELPNV